MILPRETLDNGGDLYRLVADLEAADRSEIARIRQQNILAQMREQRLARMRERLTETKEEMSR